MSQSSFVQLIPGGPVHGSIRPPGSKSLTNRALICAALASEPSVLRGTLRSDDTDAMLGGLSQLNIATRIEDGGSTIHVDPTGRVKLVESEPAEIFIGNSGTTIRFLTAALSAIGGHYRLHGVERMHQRPIADLANALEQLGCDVQTQSAKGCPPVLIQSSGWQRGAATVAGSVSSQYLSGLLLAAPANAMTIEIEIAGELVSKPYVDMTITLMEQFGVDVQRVGQSKFVIDAKSNYRGQEYDIEPDASAASYHWAAAAISGGSVTVVGLRKDAMQGDVGFVEVLRKMGCEVEYNNDQITVSGRAVRGIDIDMNAISDCVQTLAIVALFADGPTTVRGVGHNRFKETDRIGDVARELRKLGAEVEEREDGLKIYPLREDRVPDNTVTIETYNDHRMAMSFSLAGLVLPGIRILNPACTAKTYPHYFADLEQLTGRGHHWGS